LREYVTIAHSLEEVVRRMKQQPRAQRSEGVLIDPHASIEKAHAILQQMDAKFSRPIGEGKSLQLHTDVSELAAVMSLPSHVH
jgi:hypothetical protein